MNKKWWDKFLQWTFFAPIFMFFLYLALSTIAGAQNGDAFAIGGYTQGNALFSPITAFFGSLITPILTNFLQEVTLGGMIIGGLIAADSMGVKVCRLSDKSGAECRKGRAGICRQAIEKSSARDIPQSWRGKGNQRHERGKVFGATGSSGAQVGDKPSSIQFGNCGGSPS